MKKKRVYRILVLIILVTITIAIIISKSKYKLEEQTLHTQNSEMFYFESDLLNIETPEYTYSDWDGQSEYSIKFNLYNNEDKFRINTSEMRYEIKTSITSGDEGTTATTLINGTESTEGTMIPTESTDSRQKDEIEIKLNSSNQENIILKVEAISISPYKKKLGAVFNINIQEEQIGYIVNLNQTDNKDYARLLIKTNNYSGKLKIAYNKENAKPDMTNFLLKDTDPVLIVDNKYYIEITLDSTSNYQLDFIKMDVSEELTIGEDIGTADIVVGYE